MRKKVLFLIDSLSGGGAEKVLITLLKHIDKSKFEVTLCTVVSTGTYIDDIKSDINYISVLGSPNHKSFFFRLLYALKYKLVYSILPVSLVYRLFLPKGNDIEIAFCEGFVTKLMSKSNNKNAKKIAWVHIDLKCNPWPQKLGIYSNLEEEIRAYSKFDKIITVSNTVNRSFKAVYGQKDKVETIYNPIDIFEVRQKSCEFIDAYDKGRINLISVGRLVPQKGYDILVKVAEKLKGNGYKFMIRILGEGNQYDELLHYITKHNLRDCVKLMGFKKNPYPYIASSDLFICSSRSEGYSLVIAEALILGVPIISTYCSGPNELLGEGKYGILVENDENGDGLFRGLNQLLGDTEQLKEYRKRAIERSGFFSQTDIVRDIEALLINICRT